MSEVDSVISDVEVPSGAENAINDAYDGDNDDDDNEPNGDSGVDTGSKPQSAVHVDRERTRTLSSRSNSLLPTSANKSPRYKMANCEKSTN